MRALRWLLTAALVAPAGLPGTARAAMPDPTRPGPLATRALEYDAQLSVVSGTVPPVYADRLRGRVHFPAGQARPRRVVVVVPGRHDNCRVAGRDLGYAGVYAWPCPDVPPAIEDLPSWRGFDYLGRNLASHGYVVAVINTNGVNSVGGLDGSAERAQLVDATLSLLREWHAGARQVPDGVGDALRGAVDLRYVGLIGHSRGADGIGRLLRDEQERGARRWPGIRALLQVAGVDIAAANPVPAGVPVGTLLGSCDGDTRTSGTRMWERGRFVAEAAGSARVQWLLAGANHNWFNSEWWDEWAPPFFPPQPSDDAACGPRPGNRRLARADQERAGLALMAAFVRRYVGGERAFEPLMTGAAGLPASACPRSALDSGRPLPCSRLLQTAYVAPARDRLVARTGGRSLAPAGPVTVEPCEPGTQACVPGSRSVAVQDVVAWSGTARVVVPAGRDVRGFGWVSVRLGNVSTTEPADVAVALRDAAGRRREVRLGGAAAVVAQPAYPGGPSAEEPYGLVLSGARVPLTAFRGVDPSRLAAVELVLRGSGRIVLDEVLFQR